MAIVIVIIVSVLWLHAGGYSAAAALGIVAVAIRLASRLADRLVTSRPDPGQ